MFTDHFKFRAQPFGQTPDTAYLYFSSTHREALASLYYGTQSERGFLALIAEPGMGKTTLLRQLEQRLSPSIRTAYVFNTNLDSAHILRCIVEDLGTASDELSAAQLHQQFARIVTETSVNGGSVLLLVDEAQNLSEEALEGLRLLSNFETQRRKLLQIVLAGQWGLTRTLMRPGLSQLRQRIGTVARLMPLSAEETCAYIAHRLQVAGCANGSLFSDEALDVIARQSLGIPRNINNLCFNALSLAFASQAECVTRDIVEEVLNDLSLEVAPRPRSRRVIAARIANEPPIGRPLPIISLTDARKNNASEHSNDVPATVPFPLKVGVSSRSPKVPVNAMYAAGLSLLLLASLGILELRSRDNGQELRVHHRDTSLSTLPAAAPASVSTNPLHDRIGSTVSQDVNSDAGASAERVALHPQVSRDAVETYLVRPNETLLQIAKARYGTSDPKIVERIVRRNPMLRDPDHIEPGQRITLPEMEAKNNSNP